ncbi:RNA polymerase ECF-type sigma factor [hydrothermal vent metagenome]|uniref:RNA polymerase ECF-type sigma factor n=1 Tax=hydrothermal vent metagenome TaxID=652676 RepID=A0A3B0UKU9_9ZZZZ
MSADDNKLLKKFKKGDHESFEKIFNLYSKSLFRFSLSYLGSKEAAEDVVQEVFLKIWNNRKGIKLGTSFKSYLFTITLNSIRKHFNKLSRSNELKHDILYDFSENKPGFDGHPGYQELLDKLDDLIKQMPEKRKEAFVKKKIEGKSLKEISEELGVSTKTVEYHITEAMKFLKTEFDKLRISGMVFFHLFFPSKEN